jgi:hypothetical protein
MGDRDQSESLIGMGRYAQWERWGQSKRFESGKREAFMLARTLDDSRAGLEVAVVERNDQPGVWTVEAIDMKNDGNIYQALFVGPEARERAQEYARFKYSV